MKKILIACSILVMLCATPVRADQKATAEPTCYVGGSTHSIVKGQGTLVWVNAEGTGTYYLGIAGDDPTLGNDQPGFDADEVSSFTLPAGLLSNAQIAVPSGCTVCLIWMEKQ